MLLGKKCSGSEPDHDDKRDACSPLGLNPNKKRGLFLSVPLPSVPCRLFTPQKPYHHHETISKSSLACSTPVLLAKQYRVLSNGMVRKPMFPWYQPRMPKLQRLLESSIKFNSWNPQCFNSLHLVSNPYLMRDFFLFSFFPSFLPLSLFHPCLHVLSSTNQSQPRLSTHLPSFPSLNNHHRQYEHIVLHSDSSFTYLPTYTSIDFTHFTNPMLQSYQSLNQ